VTPRALVKPRKKKSAGARAPRARAGHSRQRLHLIDSCISALHVYGPSRTTVEKVVAIAKMSPGIVRFYFDSKAAMLVASLKYLAAEFEERLLVPVAQLKDDPVAALERLIRLYLDSDIASARKISVWYSFWGEASSRQEYYDICGQKDERFAALVHDLIERLIRATRQRHLDPDGIALGLIGVLEMLWQGFAFQQEATIDRAAARHRCMAYLRSVFPGQFGAGDSDVGAARYADSARFALERARLFPGVWQGVGHAGDLACAGDYLAVDLGSERALLVRDVAGRLHAFRNSCVAWPHALVPEGRGNVPSLHCPLHGLHFDPADDASAGGLVRLGLCVSDGLVFVADGSKAGAGNPAVADNPAGAGATPGELAAFTRDMPPTLRAVGAPRDTPIDADWKLIVESWLDVAPAGANPAGWSGARYAALSAAAPDTLWQRRFLFPNQLLEIRPDGASLLRAVPVAPGRSRCVLMEFEASVGAAPLLRYLAHRVTPCFRSGWRHFIESLQRGLVGYGYTEASKRPVTHALEAFRTRYDLALNTA